MNRKDRILKEVSDAVRYMMADAILDGDDRFHYEKEYGTAWIDIDFHEVRCSAFLLDDYDIRVSHEDARKSSPLLEEALRAALPDWFEMKKELRQQVA